MKPILSGCILLACTVTAIAFFPTIKAATSQATFFSKPEFPISQPGTAVQDHAIDVVFVLDTTSSMSGMIDTAKEKIWSIATTMTSAQQSSDVRIGLIAFRDKGDDYITHTVDLSDDIDSIYAELMTFQAEGGGDGPESVNSALEEAVNAISWRQNASGYQTIFLIGDAPPHMDYKTDSKYTQSIANATRKGIIVNTIQCGSNKQTKRYWQHIAQLGNGRYFQVEQSGGSIAIDTPFDQELANLSSELDRTRLYFGDDHVKRKMHKKKAATEMLQAQSSVSALARRAAFNASAAGKTNRLGEFELVDAVTSGRVAVDDLATDTLPSAFQGLSTTQQNARIKKLAERRANLQIKMESLTKKRQDYIRATVAASDKAGTSFESKLYETVRLQGKKSGLLYDQGPEY